MSNIPDFSPQQAPFKSSREQGPVLPRARARVPGSFGSVLGRAFSGEDQRLLRRACKQYGILKTKSSYYKKGSVPGP